MKLVISTGRALSTSGRYQSLGGAPHAAGEQARVALQQRLVDARRALVDRRDGGEALPRLQVDAHLDRVDQHELALADQPILDQLPAVDVGDALADLLLDALEVLGRRLRLDVLRDQVLAHVARQARERFLLREPLVDDAIGEQPADLVLEGLGNLRRVARRVHHWSSAQPKMLSRSGLSRRT
ncbi:MAG: hypothetical protein U1E76_26560 [Planctomycetota bacterium]